MLEKTVRQSAQDRHSVRKYTSDPITEQQIEALIDVAKRAPSPYNVQPWRLIAVREEQMKAKLMKAAKNQPQVGAAPVVFILTSDMEDFMKHVEEVIHPGLPEEKKPEELKSVRETFEKMGVEGRRNWGRQISYIFLGYFLLAAESLDYGTSPMLGFEPDMVRELFDLPATTEIPALISVGRKAEQGFPQHRHSVSRILKIVN